MNSLQLLLAIVLLSTELVLALPQLGQDMDAGYRARHYTVTITATTTVIVTNTIETIPSATTITSSGPVSNIPRQSAAKRGWRWPHPAPAPGQTPWPTPGFNCYNYQDVFMHDLLSVRHVSRCHTHFPVQSWATQTCYTWPGTPMQFVNKPRCQPGQNPNPPKGMGAAVQAGVSDEVVTGWIEGNVFVEAQITSRPDPGVMDEKEDRCRRGWIEDCGK